jgi:hypothetical protein
MQALYSGISYAYSEASRATQPVISTLASMMPTIGHEEAAVKKSLRTCLHEMEAVSAGKTMRGGNNPLWWNGVTNIKQVILYPATRLSQLSQEQGCRMPNAHEWANWANVTSNINQQLKNWSIPFRFNISTEAAKLDERALNSSDNQCFTVNIPDGRSLSTFVRHCDKPVIDGHLIGGSLNGCLITLQTDMPKAIYAHELAHFVSTHPHDAIPLASLHPDVLEAMCDPVTHGHELITSLNYWTHCKDMGFPDTAKHVLNSRGEWGPIDLTMAKLALNRDNSATHAQIHAEGVDKSYEWIKQNYGVRAAEQFAASFAKSVFIHSMSAIVARTVKDKLSLAVSRAVIHVFANLIHLGMMGQLFPSPWLVVGQVCAGSGLMGRTVKALVGVIGEATILNIFVRLMSSNSNAMLELVYATCGTAAGNLFSTMILRLIDLCAPTKKSQREAYLKLTKTTTFHSVSLEAAISLAAKINGVDQKVIAENIYSYLPTIIQRIVTIDSAVADVIENYVSLQVMTTWLWKTDQQKADAQVQASVDQLSDTLDEVIIEFGPSDPPNIPDYMNRFQAAQTAPTVEPFKSTDDDPIISSDVAAVTGMGRASPSKKPQEWATKKQQ